MATLCDSTDCNLPGSSARGIIQARILEWVAISFSRGSSQPRDLTYVSCGSALTGKFFTVEPAGRNINNLTYADDTTLMAESEELKNFLMKVKEEREKLA